MNYRWSTATAASRAGLAQLAKLDLMVIDDFAISPMGPAERNDLLELLDDRIGMRSTLITSQLPVKARHAYLNDRPPNVAERHSTHRLQGAWKARLAPTL